MSRSVSRTVLSNLCKRKLQLKYQKHSAKINPKITILELLVYKSQPRILKSKIFMCFNFIVKPFHYCLWTWLCNKAEMCKDFTFYYFWCYFVFQNFQNGYFRISLCTILFEDIKRNICTTWKRWQIIDELRLI